MAQSSVAREPSMEEILASIRRIIESNEPPGSAAVAPAPVAPSISDADDENDEIHLTIDDEMLAADFAEALEAAESVDSAPLAHAPASATDPAPVLSLADVAARVRAASERTANQLRQGEAVEPRAAVRAESPLVTSRMAELRATIIPSPTAAAAMRVANDAGSAGPEAARLAEGADLEEALAAIELLDSPAETFPAPAPAAVTVDDAPEPIESRVAKALLSPQAGEHVARSFGALAAAVDVSLSRSVDEIAEEMLRPMLQDWLDDNLPTLVERLVREEIERVARGPRR